MELGFEPEKSATWSAGGQLRHAYMSETGNLPPKDNRKKTSGAGTHCFAIYPDHWRKRAREIVRRTARTLSKQPGRR